MKKSQAVPATLVATIAALTLGGCGSSSRTCQDATGRIIPSGECMQSPGRSSIYSYPHWVYGRSGGFFGGSRGWGSTGTTTGGTSTGTGTTTRGGFGGGTTGSGGSSFGG